MGSGLGDAKVLIAPWGNPFVWNDAVYHLYGRTFRAKTTLLPLVEVLRPDRIIVAIPETLLCMSGKPLDTLRRYTKENVILQDYSLDSLKRDPRKYGKILNSLRGLIERFYEKEVGSAEGRLNVLMAPSVGRYRCPKIEAKWEIPEGSNIDSVYSIYILLSTVTAVNSLLEEFGGNVKEVLLALDTSHGVNFMPLSAYRAVLSAARIISAAYGIDVVFRQYNSTPFPLGVRDPDMQIYLVREEAFHPNKAAQRNVYSFLAGGEMSKVITFSTSGAYEREVLSLKRGLIGGIKSAHGAVRALAGSVHYSLPLAFLQFAEELDENSAFNGINPETVEKEVRRLFQMVVINKDFTRKKVKIVHVSAPEFKGVKAFLAAWSLASYALRALEGVRSRSEETGVEFREGRVWATLKALRNVLDDYLRGPLHAVALQEVSNIERELNKRTGFDLGGEKADCETHKRNFIAHSGLSLRSLDVVRREGGSLWLAYRKECLGQVRTLTKRALRETEEMIYLSRSDQTGL